MADITSLPGLPDVTQTISNLNEAEKAAAPVKLAATQANLALAEQEAANTQVSTDALTSIVNDAGKFSQAAAQRSQDNNATVMQKLNTFDQVSHENPLLRGVKKMLGLGPSVSDTRQDLQLASERASLTQEADQHTAKDYQDALQRSELVYTAQGRNIQAQRGVLAAKTEMAIFPIKQAESMIDLHTKAAALQKADSEATRAALGDFTNGLTEQTAGQMLHEMQKQGMSQFTTPKGLVVHAGDIQTALQDKQKSSLGVQGMRLANQAGDMENHNKFATMFAQTLDSTALESAISLGGKVLDRQGKLIANVPLDILHTAAANRSTQEVSDTSRRSSMFAAASGVEASVNQTFTAAEKVNNSLQLNYGPNVPPELSHAHAQVVANAQAASLVISDAKAKGIVLSPTRLAGLQKGIDDANNAYAAIARSSSEAESTDKPTQLLNTAYKMNGNVNPSDATDVLLNSASGGDLKGWDQDIMKGVPGAIKAAVVDVYTKAQGGTNGPHGTPTQVDVASILASMNTANPSLKGLAPVLKQKVKDAVASYMATNMLNETVNSLAVQSGVDPKMLSRAHQETDRRIAVMGQNGELDGKVKDLLSRNPGMTEANAKALISHQTFYHALNYVSQNHKDEQGRYLGDVVFDAAAKGGAGYVQSRINGGWTQQPDGSSKFLPGLRNSSIGGFAVANAVGDSVSTGVNNSLNLMGQVKHNELNESQVRAAKHTQDYGNPLKRFYDVSITAAPNFPPKDVGRVVQMINEFGLAQNQGMRNFPIDYEGILKSQKMHDPKDELIRKEIVKHWDEQSKRLDVLMAHKSQEEGFGQ